MSLTIVLGILVLTMAAAAAAWSVDARLKHAGLVRRASGTRAASAGPVLVAPSKPGIASRTAMRLHAVLPTSIAAGPGARQLTRAGFDSHAAPAVYVLLSLLFAALTTLLAVLLAPKVPVKLFALYVAAGIAVGLIVPPLVLRHLIRRRQDRLRRSLPDGLDLLLVCVEAGVSLDAAIMRVGKEMARLHPELSREFLIVNRSTAAGVRRDEALERLYDRTGVRELRALASTLIQSERWGSSIGTVLRVYAQSMRRKRRQAAEKRAAVVATQMVFPLALLILPALFIVLAGPILIGIKPIFDALTPR